MLRAAELTRLHSAANYCQLRGALFDERRRSRIPEMVGLTVEIANASSNLPARSQFSS